MRWNPTQLNEHKISKHLVTPSKLNITQVFQPQVRNEDEKAKDEVEKELGELRVSRLNILNKVSNINSNLYYCTLSSLHPDRATREV